MCIRDRLQSAGNIAREDVKIRITDLDELKQRLRTEWTKLDHVVIVAAIRQWRRRYLQISDVCFHTLLSHGFKSGEFEDGS